MTSVLLLLVALTGGVRQIPAQTISTVVVTAVVTSARTGAPLADVVVTVAPETGTDRQTRTGRTDPSGRVAITDVPTGRAMLTVSTIGYIFVRRHIDVPSAGIVDLAIPLAEGTGTYEESVDVTAGPPTMPVGQARELSSGALQELRGVATDDPVRAVQALPGVATGDDFQAEFSVRGSAYRQVGLVLDGVATPLLFHSVRGTQDTGSIAMINTDVISRAALHIGPHAPRHGNWLGATLEFDIREGSRDRLAIRGAVSGTNASTVIEGPLTRGRRGSWLLSVRKSYVDWLVRKIDSQFDSAIGFLDAQAKLVFDLTPRQQLQVLLLGGDATYTKASAESANELARATSSSGLVSAAWRVATSRVLVSQRLSLVSNRFRNRGRADQEQARGDSDSVTWRADATLPIGRWTFEAGADATRDHVATSLRNFTASTSGLRVRAERITDTRRTTTGGFAGAGGRVAGVALGTGVRVSHDTLTGATSTSPWVMAERDIKGMRLTASASRVVQYPTIDQAAAATSLMVPERAWLFDAGVRRPLSTSLGLATTVFRRSEADIIRRESEHRLVNGLRIAESLFPALSSNLDGTSRGVDVTVERRADRGPTGWLGYTWSHTRYEDRITGERFDGDFDQRHTLNLFLQQRLSHRLRISARFRYGSNFPIVGYFEGSADALRLAGTRNQVRLPAYARLDLSASRTFTYQRSRLTLFVEVMNATNRDNYGPADGFVRSTLVAENFSERLLPIVPSAGILLEF